MIEYRELTFGGTSCGVLDFEKAAFAYLELAWEGKESLEVSIGECLKEGRIDRSPGGFRCFKKLHIEQKAPGAWQRVELPPHRTPYPDGNPPLPYPAEAGGEIAPFRYVEISGACGPVRVRRAVIFPEWNENAACFESDHAELDRVWEFCKYSMKATAAFGMFIDGERERVPYEGDSYINQLGYFCCDANYAVAGATIDYLLENPTWPTEWSLLLPLLVRDHFLYSGDRRSVERWLPRLKKFLLSEDADQFGFIGKKERGDIIDWPPAERDGYELGDRNAVPNCYRYGALLAMNELTGEKEYLLKAEELRKNLRQKFFRGGFWRDNLVSEHYSLHGAVFAQVFGVTEPDEYAAINDFLLQRGMVCSVYGAQFLLEAFGTLRNPAAMLGLMTGTGPRSWLNMIKQGTTITMESWDNEIKPNQDWNHAWGAAPANIIPRWIAGIRPCQAGFREFVLDPQPGYLKHFFCRKPTPCGPVEIEWNNGKGTVTVPEGTAAVCGNKYLKEGKHDLPY